MAMSCKQRDWFFSMKPRWDESLKNGRTSSVFHDSPTPWQPQGVASNVLLDHLDSWPTPGCSSQKSRSTPGRARFSGVRGPATTSFFPPQFLVKSRGNPCWKSLKDMALSEKNGCHDHMSANSKVLSFLGPFLGHWELQTAKRPFFGRNRWL